MNVDEVAPAIGFDVSPEAPRNHWYVSDEPVASTASVTGVPGCAVDGVALAALIAGALQVCVAVMVATLDVTVEHALAILA